MSIRRSACIHPRLAHAPNTSQPRAPKRIQLPMRRHFPLVTLLLLCAPLLAQGPSSSLFGDWRAPGGSIIRIAPCGHDVCATLAALSPQAPSRFDIHNPKSSLRTRPLCGLVIGRGFHTDAPNHATGGTLYDPKTGKTYHGEMTAKSTTLALRGYIGLPLFGRTENWTRSTPPRGCTA